MRFVTPKQAFPPGYRDDLPARSEYPRPAPGAPPGAALGAAPGVEIDEAGTVVTRFEEDEAEAREAAREGLGVRRRQLEEELRSLTQDTREDNIMQEKDIIRGTPLRSVRRLRQVDWEFRQFELRREIGLEIDPKLVTAARAPEHDGDDHERGEMGRSRHRDPLHHPPPSREGTRATSTFAISSILRRWPDGSRSPPC